MALAQEDIEQIQQLIKNTLSQTPETLNANVRYELDLRERTIRIEEELKHQRELMIEGFKQIQLDMDKRLEQVDKRIDGFIIWSFALASLTLAVLVIAILKFLP